MTYRLEMLSIKSNVKYRVYCTSIIETCAQAFSLHCLLIELEFSAPLHLYFLPILLFNS